MEVPTETKDPRLEWLSEYTCRTMRVKPDKWARMMVSDEQRTFLNKFIDSRQPQVCSYSLFLLKYFVTMR